MSHSPPPPPPPPLQHLNNLDNNISPSILLIIVIIAIIFFISGLLHLLVRLLLRPTRQIQTQTEGDHVTVLQGQLQQLFHLHDSGVDQSYIDTLPVFFYKAIIGGFKDPFDCAVCLCEFEGNHKLRLLPMCSHAFHVECIDTWLLSHSTCPLCRSSLLTDCGGGWCSPIVCVLESGSVDHSREILGVSGTNPLLSQTQSHFGSGQVEFNKKSCDATHEERIVSVKLGKFRNVDSGVGEGSSENNNSNNNNNNIDNNINNISSSGGKDDLGSRRCYSMGSFAYVLDETTSLQVPIRNTPIKKKQSSTRTNKKANLPIRPGHRAVMSEYGCESNREFNGIEPLKAVESRHSNGESENGDGIGISKRRESFSISKIWGKNNNKIANNNGNESSRRSTCNSIEIGVSELGNDEETQSCYSLDSLAFPTTTSTSSSTRRTLLWLMGRQNNNNNNNKIVHNHSTSWSSNV
ncbi:hypothetical protein vseg_016262 [Gypsophila vaccaria]